MSQNVRLSKMFALSSSDASRYIGEVDYISGRTYYFLDCVSLLYKVRILFILRKCNFFSRTVYSPYGSSATGSCTIYLLRLETVFSSMQ